MNKEQNKNACCMNKEQNKNACCMNKEQNKNACCMNKKTAFVIIHSLQINFSGTC